jgi:hypothetical protein
VARLKLELHLPGSVIGVDDIQPTGLSRGFGRAKRAGPYLIAGRASGLALDATRQTGQGHRVATWPPHALAHHLWQSSSTSAGSSLYQKRVNPGTGSHVD